MKVVGKFFDRWFWLVLWSAITGLNIGSAVDFAEKGDVVLAVIDSGWALVFLALIVFELRKARGSK